MTNGRGTATIGTATSPATWYVNGFDQDYGSVGPVFTTPGTTVDSTFTPAPDLTLLEMCVRNSSRQKISVAFTLLAA